MRNAYCINDGCGIQFDPTIPETRNLETLRPFAMFYCEKHRIPTLPADEERALEMHASNIPTNDEPQDEEEETRERITCDQCELLAINGICCHETGCPNMGSRWDAENREWIKQRKCFECGCEVDADDPCCSAPFEEEEEEEEEDVLRSTVDTPEMEQAVLSEARDTLERHNLTATFEHGHWWIEDKEDGAQWSVVDCETATGEEYFDFEQVTQGEED